MDTEKRLKEAIGILYDATLYQLALREVSPPLWTLHAIDFLNGPAREVDWLPYRGKIQK